MKTSIHFLKSWGAQKIQLTSKKAAALNIKSGDLLQAGLITENTLELL